jgi:hypothetical protein
VRTLTELKAKDRSNIYNYLIILSLEFSALSFQFSSWSYNLWAVDLNTHASILGIEIAIRILSIALQVRGFERIGAAIETSVGDKAHIILCPHMFI